MKNFFKYIYNYLFRSKRSFSQTGEDLILDFYLRDIHNGFFVDIGTNHPVYLNNTYLLYKKGWSGVCVEPSPLAGKFIRLVRPRDTVVQAGIGKVEGSMEFFVFDPDTISTFSEEEAKEYQKLGHRLVATEKVEVMTLEKLLDRYSKGREVDLLSVDVEGLDMEVLQSNNWGKYRPKVVVVEVVEYRKDNSNRKNKQFDEFFHTQGYIKFADTYINTIYMEHSFAQRHGYSGS